MEVFAQHFDARTSYSGEFVPAFDRVTVVFEREDVPSPKETYAFVEKIVADLSHSDRLTLSGIEDRLLKSLPTPGVTATESVQVERRWKMSYHDAEKLAKSRITSALSKLVDAGALRKFSPNEQVPNPDGTMQYHGSYAIYTLPGAAEEWARQGEEARTQDGRHRAAIDERIDKLSGWAAEHGVSFSSVNEPNQFDRRRYVPSGRVQMTVDDLERLLIAAAK